MIFYKLQFYSDIWYEGKGKVLVGHLANRTQPGPGPRHAKTRCDLYQEDSPCLSRFLSTLSSTLSPRGLVLLVSRSILVLGLARRLKCTLKCSFQSSFVPARLEWILRFPGNLRYICLEKSWSFLLLVSNVSWGGLLQMRRLEESVVLVPARLKCILRCPSNSSQMRPEVYRPWLQLVLYSPRGIPVFAPACLECILKYSGGSSRMRLDSWVPWSCFKLIRSRIDIFERMKTQMQPRQASQFPQVA